MYQLLLRKLHSIGHNLCSCAPQRNVYSKTNMSNGNGNQKSSYKGGVLKKSLSFEGKDLFIHKMFAELTRRKKAANIKPDFNIDVFMKAAATEGQKASVVTDYYLKVAAMLQKLEKEIDDVDAKIGEGWLLLDSPTISIVKLMR